MADKNIVMHPLIDGIEDDSTNLFPKTKKENILDFGVVAADINSGNAAEGQVLTADGSGGASFESVRTYQDFPASWLSYTSGTTGDFCSMVNSDTSAVGGMAYLGELRCSDLPTGLANVEAIVEIVSDTNLHSKVIHIAISSGNVAPYRWEYTYWAGNSPKGWIGFQPQLTAGSNISISGTTISATDTTYSSLAAAEGGTDVSLVTTGEKYVWGQKSSRIFADDVTALTAAQLDALDCGDFVIKETGNSKHTYVVSYKDATKGELSLTYTDHETIEEVYYEKVSDVWTYIQTDTVNLGDLEPAPTVIRNVSPVWASDATYQDYGYKGTVTISGVTATMRPEVTFGLTESLSGNYAPICDAVTDGVVIYGKVDTAIVIPMVVVYKR